MTITTAKAVANASARTAAAAGRRRIGGAEQKGRSNRGL